MASLPDRRLQIRRVGLVPLAAPNSIPPVAKPRPAGQPAEIVRVARGALAAPAAAWHAEPIDVVGARLVANPSDGLSQREAQRRLAAYGSNALAEDSPPSRLALLASQIANLPTGLLLGSTV